MVDTFTNIEIKLDRESATYYGGEKITGKIKVCNKKPLTCKGISIEVHGRYEIFAYDQQAEAQMTLNSGRNSTFRFYSYSEEERERNIDRHYNYYEHAYTFDMPVVYVIGNGKNKIEIPAGSIYNFTYRLPKNFPPSITEQQKEKLIYNITARLEQKISYFSRTSQQIQYISLIDLSKIPNLQIPVKDDMSKSYSRCCSNKGSLSLSASIDKKGYSPGEKIKVSILCENETEFTIRLVLELFGYCKKNYGTYKSLHNNEYKKLIVRVQRLIKPVEPSVLFKQHEIIVPENVCLNNFSLMKGIVELIYVVQVHAIMPRCYSNAVVTLPIILGVNSLKEIIRDEPLTSYLDHFPYTFEKNNFSFE